MSFFEIENKIRDSTKRNNQLFENQNCLETYKLHSRIMSWFYMYLQTPVEYQLGVGVIPMDTGANGNNA